jgi:hypothetical protein
MRGLAKVGGGEGVDRKTAGFAALAELAARSAEALASGGLREKRS